MSGRDMRARGGGDVRMGPISVFALVIILGMAVLAVLAVSTATASLSMTQRMAAATGELYGDEEAAQTFLAALDLRLGGARDAGEGGVQAARDVYAELADIRDEVQAAVPGVQVSASFSGQSVQAEFSCANGRTLSVGVTVLPDATYRIDSWKVTAVQNEAQPEQLWLG